MTRYQNRKNELNKNFYENLFSTVVDLFKGLDARPNVLSNDVAQLKNNLSKIHTKVGELEESLDKSDVRVGELEESLDQFVDDFDQMIKNQQFLGKALEVTVANSDSADNYSFRYRGILPKINSNKFCDQSLDKSDVVFFEVDKHCIPNPGHSLIYYKTGDDIDIVGYVSSSFEAPHYIEKEETTIVKCPNDRHFYLVAGDVTLDSCPDFGFVGVVPSGE